MGRRGFPATEVRRAVRRCTPSARHVSAVCHRRHDFLKEDRYAHEGPNQREGERQREGGRKRQRGRSRDRQTETHTHRETERQTEKEMGEEHRFSLSQLCRSVALPVSALTSQGITTLPQLAALDDGAVALLCTFTGLEREAVRSARRGAREYVSQRDEQRGEDRETESEKERRWVLSGGRKRSRSSSSSDEEVVNEASEESDYEPSSETAARRTRPQRRKRVTDRRADQDRHTERQSRKAGTLEDVVDGPLAGLFTKQGLATVEDLAGVVPGFYSSMAAEAGVRQAPPLLHSFLHTKLKSPCAAGGGERDHRGRWESAAARPGGRDPRRAAERRAGRQRDWPPPQLARVEQEGGGQTESAAAVARQQAGSSGGRPARAAPVPLRFPLQRLLALQVLLPNLRQPFHTNHCVLIATVLFAARAACWRR